MAHQLIIDIEMQAASVTEPFPGIRELLGQLREHGAKLGVVTRNCRPAVLATFPDLLDWVDVLTARGDCPYLKPDLRHARFCLDKMQIRPHRATMVGDGQLDMVLGRDLNMYCVGVLSGSSQADALVAKGAHHTLAQLSSTTPLEALLAISDQ